jgi:hypothetical protein
MRTQVENEGEGKLLRVTVGLSSHTYSRLALFAKRHEHSLGEEIRTVLDAYVQRELWKADKPPGYAERTITRDKSRESG